MKVLKVEDYFVYFPLIVELRMMLSMCTAHGNAVWFHGKEGHHE